MNIVLNHFDKQSKTSLLARGYVTVVLISIIDYFSGPKLPMFALYFYPIIIVSWYIGREKGIYIAAISALATLVNNLLFYISVTSIHPLNLIILWDFLQRLAVFVIISITVSALKRSENEKMQYEIKVARQVQAFLLPQTLPSMNTLSYHGARKSLNGVSGDFYDFLLIQPHKLLIVIGDICGKGMSAALLMAHIHGVLRSISYIKGHNLSDLMTIINSSLHASTEDNKFATLFLGVYDDNDRTLAYVNAGHNSPIVFRNKENISQIQRLNTEGMILGFDPNANYKVKKEQLYPGDTLLFFTDGITEARNDAKEEYGEERIVDTISVNRERPPLILCDLIFKELENYIGSEHQDDDMTLIVGKVN
jgi:sigma-B regulation protein RsbU (phosphoserine phosphatase)